MFIYLKPQWLWAAVTDLKHPGSSLRSVLQETGSLFAGGFFQPALVVHVSQTLGAPDLSAGRLVVWPNTIQSYLCPPMNTHTRTGLPTDNWAVWGTNVTIQWPVSYYRMLSYCSPVKPLSLWRLVFVIRIHDDFFASEVDDLIEVQSCHVHLPRKEDGAVACEGQSEQSSEPSVQSGLTCIVVHHITLYNPWQIKLGFILSKSSLDF